MDVDPDLVPPRVPPGPGLVESVVAAFSLPRPDRWTDLGGLWTTNLRLDYADGSALVARVHRSTTSPQRLHAVQSAREVVRSSGLPVPEPARAPGGRGFCTMADGTLAEVEEHVDWDTPMKTFAYLHKGFAALARLHDALRTLRFDEPVAPPPHATYLDPEGLVEAVRRGQPGCAAGRVTRPSRPCPTTYSGSARRSRPGRRGSVTTRCGNSSTATFGADLAVRLPTAGVVLADLPRWTRALTSRTTPGRRGGR